MKKFTSEKEEQNFIATVNLAKARLYVGNNKLYEDSEAILLYKCCIFLQNHDSNLAGKHTNCFAKGQECQSIKNMLRSYISQHGIAESALLHICKQRKDYCRPAADYIINLCREIQKELPASVENELKKD